jgi:tRNA(fMet)-specific endonuclease VapC
MDETAVWYADVRMKLKRIGKPIPENDIWIAGICRQFDLTLATSDAHFDLVDGLRVLKRPAPFGKS